MKQVLVLQEQQSIKPLLTDSTVQHILRLLLSGPKRYSDLVLKGVSSKTLSVRLKTLEAAGCIEKQLFAQVPPKSEYSLTAKGSELISILSAIDEWEESWLRRS